MRKRLVNALAAAILLALSGAAGASKVTVTLTDAWNAGFELRHDSGVFVFGSYSVPVNSRVLWGWVEGRQHSWLEFSVRYVDFDPVSKVVTLERVSQRSLSRPETVQIRVQADRPTVAAIDLGFGATMMVDILSVDDLGWVLRLDEPDESSLVYDYHI